MKFYTLADKDSVLKSLNYNGGKLSWRDRHITKRFGGKIFTEDMFLSDIQNELKARNNSQATQDKIPTMMFNWWKKRGAIVEIT